MVLNRVRNIHVSDNSFVAGKTLCHFLLLVLLGWSKQVSLDKELQKEEQIASIHDHGSIGILHLQVAVAGLLDEQQVETHGCNGDTYHHLTNLGNRNPNGLEPFGFAPYRHQKVVKVHNGMDCIVHGAKDDTRGRILQVGNPAVDQHGNVMVPVKEDERFLVYNNEERIKQFATGKRVRLSSHIRT